MSRHATPLRYPGGKQRLTPFILELLEENGCLGGHYVEPYAGGAGVAMDLLLSDKVAHVHLNDSSYPIYAFWNSVLTTSDELCKLVSETPLTVDEWLRQREILRNPNVHTELQVGFSTFYLNRCNRSGVLTGGVIGGLKQIGKWLIDARFTRAELVRRIEAIAARAEAITLRNEDAEQFIIRHIPDLPENTLVYLDPPYYEKSARLYLNRYTDEDHARIAAVIQNQLPRKWVVSYDGAPPILELYAERNSFLYQLQYNASRAYKGTEVFIFSDDVMVPASSALHYINTALQAENPATAADELLAAPV